jgi:hypothetical protein
MVWFAEWVVEGYSVRQLVRISRRGIWKIKQIINYWIHQPTPALKVNLSKIKYLIFDGTYFRHENCFILLLDGLTGKAVDYLYGVRENFVSAYKIFERNKEQGLNPLGITIDGNIEVIRALKQIWPNLIIQRCLAHIQRQGLSWLRKYPKSEAAKELRKIYLTIFYITNYETRDKFIDNVKQWEKKYGEIVKSMPSKDRVCGDLQRARSMIIHAQPNMFHFLDNSKIASTTNMLEGYFSHIKIRYQQHRGLSKIIRPKYLFWYIYLKNKS